MGNVERRRLIFLLCEFKQEERKFDFFVENRMEAIDCEKSATEELKKSKYERVAFRAGTASASARKFRAT